MKTIVGVALICAYDGICYSLPKPYRHHHIIQALVAQDFPTPITGKQGFITSDGEFVNRIIGAGIALEVKQIVSLKWPPNLFSEDLW